MKKKKHLHIERFRKNPRGKSCISLENIIQFLPKATAACLFPFSNSKLTHIDQLFRVPSSFIRRGTVIGKHNFCWQSFAYCASYNINCTHLNLWRWLLWSSPIKGWCSVRLAFEVAKWWYQNWNSCSRQI